MTNEQAKKMLKAKLECLKREISGIDCNDGYYCDECSLNYEQGNMGEQKEALDMAIKALEPQHGKWLDKKMTIKGGHGLAYGRYECSVCKKKQPSKTDFCPNCGADMRGSEEIK